MLAIRLTIFTLFLTLGHFASAEMVCGFDIKEDNIFKAEHTGYDNHIRRGVRESKTAKACFQNGELYGVFESEDEEGSKVLAAYHRKSILTPDAILRRELTQQQRETFIKSMVNQALLTISTALESRAISDQEVLTALKAIQSQLKSNPPISSLAPSKNPRCKKQSVSVVKNMPTEGGAFAYSNPLDQTVYFCTAAYEEESPFTLIHEMTHHIHGNYPLAWYPYQECLADLVAKTAIEIARAYDGTNIPNLWRQNGTYEPFCKGDFKVRFPELDVTAGNLRKLRR